MWLNLVLLLIAFGGYQLAAHSDVSLLGRIGSLAFTLSLFVFTLSFPFWLVDSWRGYRSRASREDEAP